MNNMQILKRFLPYAKEQKALYALAFIGSIFRFLIPLAVPLVMKYMFDHLLQSDAYDAAEQTRRVLAIFGIMVGVFLIIRGPMEYIRQFFMHKANNHMIRRLRRDVFKKLHQLDAGYMSEQKSGAIAARFFEDIEKVRGLTTALLANI